MCGRVKECTAVSRLIGGNYERCKFARETDGISTLFNTDPTDPAYFDDYCPDSCSSASEIPFRKSYPLGYHRSIFTDHRPDYLFYGWQGRGIMAILELNHVSKSFGSVAVIRDLSFRVEEHSVFGFLGRNGAGKTTTMKMVLGFLQSDSGSISVNGNKVTFGSTKTNQDIGYLPDVPEFYGYMNPKEYLRLCGEITGLSKEAIHRRSAEMLSLVGLDGVNRRISGFSRGMKQRLGIAQALLNEPKLLICDEPTSALDPVGRKEILDILSIAREKTTVVFSTHILSDVERICDSIGILEGGKLALSGSVAEEKNNKRKDVIQLETIRGSTGEAFAEKLRSLSFVTGVTQEENRLSVGLTHLVENNQKLLAFLVEEKIPLLRYEVLEPTLENLFMEVMR